MLIISQVVVPDYRVALFGMIHDELSNVVFIAGENYFSPATRSAALGMHWHIKIDNHFLFSRRLLWQDDIFMKSISSSAITAELNPRILNVFLAAIIRNLLRRPMVIWGHVGKADRLDRPSAFLRRALLEICSGFIAYTGSDRLRMRRAGYRRPIWVTHNSCLYRADCRYIPNPNRHSIIYVGRLVAPKKVDLLVRGFAQTLKRNNLINLEIVGDGPEASNLKSLVKELNLEGRVTFHGHQSEITFLQTLYDRSFLATSPGYVGLSVIQALGHGVPVLVARNEPHSPEIEACQEGFNTLFFESDNVPDCALKIEEAWKDRTDWAVKGDTISRSIRLRYTYESMAKAIIDAINYQIDVDYLEVI